MFGFSLTKLLFTAIAIAAVWYGFKWFQRAQMRQEETRAKVREEVKADRAAKRQAKPADDAEDMVECRECGAYVPAKGARSCGRSDCPYPG